MSWDNMKRQVCGGDSGGELTYLPPILSFIVFKFLVFIDESFTF